MVGVDLSFTEWSKLNYRRVIFLWDLLVCLANLSTLSIFSGAEYEVADKEPVRFYQKYRYGLISIFVCLITTHA